MRFPLRGLLTAVLVLSPGAAWAADDEVKAKIAAQKKTAETVWTTIEAGDAAPVHETSRVLLVAPKSEEKRLTTLGNLMDKAYDKACAALKIDPVKEAPWAGKLTVYITTEREHFTAFVRRIEKRRLETGEVGTFDADRDAPHALGGPPRTKADPSAEVQAIQQIGCALLQKKAGTKVPLPGWLLVGFGRATYYRVAPNDSAVANERKKAAALVRMGRGCGDVFADRLSPDDGIPLGASMADFLAYGPGAKKFTEMVAAFRPEENQESRPIGQVLESLSMKVDQLDKSWRGWVPRAP
jgi:hypothetical protein